jgi:PTS system ascorbate-specific IIA component
MSVGIVVVTHGRTGSAMLAEAEFILGQDLKAVERVAFDHSEDHTAGIVAIHEAIEKVDGGNGVLVLTDLIGASPSNRVSVLLEHYDAVMVTGVNLAMLISVWNYRERALGMLARKAVEAGRKGIKIFQK